MTIHRSRKAIWPLVPILSALAGIVSAHDVPPVAYQIDPLVVEGHYDNAVGSRMPSVRAA